MEFARRSMLNWTKINPSRQEEQRSGQGGHGTVQHSTAHVHRCFPHLCRRQRGRPNFDLVSGPLKLRAPMLDPSTMRIGGGCVVGFLRATLNQHTRISVRKLQK